MARAFLFVLDSFGIGHASDAARFGDEGANTLGHIAEACARGDADRPGIRHGPLLLPNLERLGLRQAADIAAGRSAAPSSDLRQGAFFGAAQEVSNGKDTPSGHWEIAGLPVPFDWGYFPLAVPAFPRELLDAITREAGLDGTLANIHASGTEVIARYGEEHCATGKPIFYTSADSVLQIAAHEEVFGLERLYALCAIARTHVDPLNIGRVIARPFTGTDAASFRRTANRRDYAVPPPSPTLLNRVEAAGRRVFGIGKISDIFAGSGITCARKAPNNDAVFDASLAAMEEAQSGDLVFSNFVDFDMLYGHRRDVGGYAAALEAFDRRLPEVLDALRGGDMLVLTADHGCDPTWQGTDHTRERVPVLGLVPGRQSGAIGLRSSFSDIGETLARHLGIARGNHGTPFHA